MSLKKNWKYIMRIYHSMAVERREAGGPTLSGDADGCDYWLLSNTTVSQLPTGIYAAPLVLNIKI